MLLVLWAFCGAAWADVNDGLIAHWGFDEGGGTVAHDSAGDNDGNIYGAQWTDGMIGGALDFDGVNDYIDTTSADLGLTGADTITISLWINPRGSGGSDVQIVSDYEKGSTWGWMLEFSADNEFRATNIGSPATSRRRVSSVLSLNQWHHVVAVIYPDDRYPEIYVDGLPDNNPYPSGSAPTQLYRGSGNVIIGRQSTPAERYFNGTLDDVRVYERALSVEEIKELYFGGLNLHGTDRAIIKITRAIDKKINMLEAIDRTLERELAVYNLLERLLENKDYGDLEKNDIIKAKQKVQSAIKCEEQSERDLEKSIGELERALEALGVELEAEPNLVAHWKFDEGGGSTASDSAGDNDGTIYGAQWADGQIGGALDFDGVDDYIDTTSADLGLTGTDTITISLWINPKGSVGSDVQIVSDYEKGSTWGWMLEFCPDNKFRATNIGYTASRRRESSVLSLNQWHHIAAVIYPDDRYPEIYVDGLPDNNPYPSGGTPTQLYMGSGNVTIGRQSTPAERYFNSMIDDLRIYDAALSAEQVEQLYEEGLTGKGKGKK
jgi:hypothetical protein